MTPRALLLLGVLCGGCIFTSRPMPPPDEETDAGGTMFGDVAAVGDTAVPGLDVPTASDAPVYDIPKPFDASAPDAVASDVSASDVATASDGGASDASATDARTGEFCDDDLDGGLRDGATHDRMAPCDVSDAGDAGEVSDAGDVSDASDAGDASDVSADARETGDSL